MKTTAKLLGAAAAFSLGLLALGTSASAGTTPYPNAGHQNTVIYTFTATTTGDLTGYFDGKGDAGDIDTVGLIDNGVIYGPGLNNHTSNVGDAFDFGHVTAGDTLTFYMLVNDGNTYYSDPGMNADGVQHVYSTSFSGADGIPAGTYIGFEDLYGGGDLNYQDDQFVVSNVIASVPEPAAWALLMLGIGAVGAAMRVQRRREALALTIA